MPTMTDRNSIQTLPVTEASSRIDAKILYREKIALPWGWPDDSMSGWGLRRGIYNVPQQEEDGSSLKLSR
jgi:hypothetical protein